MLRDASDKSKEIPENEADKKLSPSGVASIQGEKGDDRFQKSSPIMDSEDLLARNQIPQKDVKRVLGRDSLWRSDDGQPIEPKGREGRGTDYEKLKGVNIGGTFPVIDDYKKDTGTVTSDKSIDLNTPTYRDHPNESKTVINGYIDDLAKFDGGASTQGGRRIEIRPNDIKQRNLDLGIPTSTCKGDNETMLKDCNRYAKNKNINLNIDEVP